jgi:hypothetical protein
MSNKKKDKKKPNNDLQNTTHKIKDRETQTPLQTGGELRKQAFHELFRQTIKNILK